MLLRKFAILLECFRNTIYTIFYFWDLICLFSVLVHRAASDTISSISFVDGYLSSRFFIDLCMQADFVIGSSCNRFYRLQKLPYLEVKLC